MEKDLDDPDFGLPKYYDISVDFGEKSMLRVHHSRLLRFIGRELPGEEMRRENFWGASELEHIKSEKGKNPPGVPDQCLRVFFLLKNVVWGN